MPDTKPLLSSAYVSETHTTGKSLVRCLTKLEEAIRDEERATSVSALYIMAVYLQAPALTEEEIQKMVWAISKNVCLLLAGTDKPTEEVMH